MVSIGYLVCASLLIPTATSSMQADAMQVLARGAASRYQSFAERLIPISSHAAGVDSLLAFEMNYDREARRWERGFSRISWPAVDGDDNGSLSVDFGAMAESLKGGGAGLDDIDGDSMPDLLLTLRGAESPAAVFSSNGSLIRRLNGLEGYHLQTRCESAAGDIDGDSVGDYVVGWVRDTTTSQIGLPSRSVVTTYSGSTGEPIWSLRFDEALGPGLIAGTIDFSGDAVPDVAISLLSEEAKTMSVVILNGASGEQVREMRHSLPYGAWRPVAIPDADGDGNAEIVLHYTGGNEVVARDGMGRVAVFNGHSGRLLYEASGSPGSGFGCSVVSIDDIDGDRVSDLAVGAPHETDEEGGGGCVYLLSGASGEMIRKVSSTIGGRFGADLVAGRPGSASFFVAVPDAKDGTGRRGAVVCVSVSDPLVSETVPPE